MTATLVNDEPICVERDHEPDAGQLPVEGVAKAGEGAEQRDPEHLDEHLNKSNCIHYHFVRIKVSRNSRCDRFCSAAGNFCCA
jgi:hypothetical protein